jgi:hypothetical protein
VGEPVVVVVEGADVVEDAVALGEVLDEDAGVSLEAVTVDAGATVDGDAAAWSPAAVSTGRMVEDTDTSPDDNTTGDPRSPGTRSSKALAALRHPAPSATKLESIGCHAPDPSRNRTGTGDIAVRNPPGVTTVDENSVPIPGTSSPIVGACDGSPDGNDSRGASPDGGGPDSAAETSCASTRNGAATAATITNTTANTMAATRRLEAARPFIPHPLPLKSDLPPATPSGADTALRGDRCKSPVGDSWGPCVTKCSRCG